MQFLVGAVAGTGWLGLASVIGVDILEEIVTGKKRKATGDLVKVLRIMSKTRKRLQNFAPTLESVLFDLLWFSLLQGQFQHILPAMGNDPKVASRAAGTIAVQLGQQALDSRLTVTSVLWSMFMQFSIKMTTSIPSAAKSTVDQFKNTNDEFNNNLSNVLQSVGIILSEDEKKKIIEEIEANPNEIKNTFCDLLKELKALPSH